MIFNWFKPRKTKLQERPMWEYSEKPYYEKEHEETKEIVADILNKLNEIKILVEEMKANEKK